MPASGELPDWCALYFDFHGEPNKTEHSESAGWALYTGPELNFPWEVISENEQILIRYRISERAAQRAAAGAT